MATQTKRDFYEKRYSALALERSSFIDHWKELAKFILPRKGRFFVEDHNKGDKRYQSIVNSRATQAIKISRAGLMSGVMSPSRPWFSLEPQNDALAGDQQVRVWLDSVTKLMLGIFNRSNLFNMAPIMFADLLLFGTGAMSQLDDDKDVIRFYTHPIGSYVIGQNDRYEVDTLIRKFQMTIQQIVDQFGYVNCSTEVQALYDKGSYDTWRTVMHYIGPNQDADSTKASSKNKPVASCYWEEGCRDKDKFLGESGYDEFPAYVPRWDLTGEDVWGTDSPGMVALGDAKQLQILERRKGQAIDKLVNPPLQGPASLKNVPVSSLPGGLTIYDSDVAKNQLQPIYQVDPRLNEMNQDIQGVEGRINEAFYVDLFFAISQMEGVQPRNQLELTQRNQERLVQLGPVLERLYNDFLSNMIERTFNVLARKSLLPTPPPALEGQPLNVQFVSSLAMAQRSAEIAAINDMRLYVTELASGGFQEAVDKFNADESIDELSQITGVPAKLIRSDQEVAAIRKQRQDATQQAMAEQQMAQLSQQLVNRTNTP